MNEPRFRLEWGTCIRHGHVYERCCVLFEPRKSTNFLCWHRVQAFSELAAARMQEAVGG